MLITMDIKFLILHLLLWDLLLVDKVLFLKLITHSLVTLMVRYAPISYSLASTILSQVLKFKFSYTTLHMVVFLRSMVVFLLSMAVLLRSTVVSDALQRLFSKFLVMDDKGGEE
jgi:hypothetical protein